jgi:hypothetical protein
MIKLNKTIICYQMNPIFFIIIINVDIQTSLRVLINITSSEINDHISF